MSEKLLNLFLGFVITIFVARYLGPKDFGTLAYSISLTTLFATAGHMGLSGLIVREVVKKPEISNEILGTTVALKAVGSTVGLLAVCLLAYLTEVRHSIEFWVLIIVASSLFFRFSDVFDFWFQAHVQGKYTSISRGTALGFASLFKGGLIFFGTGLLPFAFANLIQIVIASGLLFFFYCKTSTVPIRTWFASCRKSKELISQGTVIFLGTIFAAIYLKIDQVMLKWFIGSGEVGVYSVASTISEAWYFVPTAIVISFFPKLINLHEESSEIFNKRLQQLFDLLCSLALVVAIIVNLLAEPLMEFLYGSEYSSSAPILSIHIWSAIFIFMRAAFSKWIIIENVLVFSFITQGFGALTNVLLNLFFIPSYGGRGAAVATLVSYAAASYLSLFFYRKSRPVFWMMTRSLVSPARYAYAIIRGR